MDALVQRNKYTMYCAYRIAQLAQLVEDFLERRDPVQASEHKGQGQRLHVFRGKGMVLEVGGFDKRHDTAVLVHSSDNDLDCIAPKELQGVRGIDVYKRQVI